MNPVAEVASPPKPSAHGVVARFFRNVFTLDPRALGVYRIAMGVIMMAKLIMLWPDLPLLCAPDGLLPLSLLSAHTAAPWSTLSIYAWPGGAGGIYLLGAIHFALAVAFALGWRSRWTVPLLWYFTISLYTRNPLVINGGDRVTMILLLISIFLPVASRYSLDARRRPDAPGPVARTLYTAASACFILQLIIIYVWSGYAKQHGVWVLSFTALEIAYREQSYVTWGAHLLLGYPLLLKGLTAFTLFMERWGIFLLLSPWRTTFFRTLITLIYIGFHIGIAATFQIGVFPYVCAAAWLVLLPSSVFDRLDRWTAARSGAGEPERLFDQRPVAYLLGVGVALYTLKATLTPGTPGTLAYALTQPVRTLRLVQKWDLFAPRPYYRTRWFVVQGSTADGRRIVLYPARETQLTPAQEPEVMPTEYCSSHLRKYFRQVQKLDKPELYEAGINGFRRYWGAPPDEKGEIRWEWVCWFVRHYPVAGEPVRTVAYPMPEVKEEAKP